MEVYDVIIVGGGPAGLNAAVVLGRCRRRVLVFDSRQYRNQASQGMHNYLTRDGILPLEFIRTCQSELKKYGVELLHKKVRNGKKNSDGLFVVRDENETLYYSKKLLIATGLTDNVPEITGFRELYGKSIFHCPYCDGWEVQDKKLGVYAREKDGSELSKMLKGWSSDVTLFTDGNRRMKPSIREELEACGVEVVTLPIDRVEGTGGQLEKIVFKNGREHPCDALFFVNGYRQHCDLVDVFNCEITKKGVVRTNRFQQTTTAGLFVAGDADKDMHFVVVAAAEGAKAGTIINRELQREINAQLLLQKEQAG
ncbi:NAD(P)/FAD-dependent oxidoreductase [Paraflavisolibacter sp. H34]|uniref:NAD(P)/FAD-dependent oxidoreductase n=1 Tax=Huijunlia imazamoxiresistens TaxID=3127457 RepID=UPI0030194EBF